jgi:RimJ/RimL family protein N-acetyltransferase
MHVQLIPYQPEFLDMFIAWRNEAATLRHNPLVSFNREETARLRLAEGSDLRNLKKYENYRWFIKADESIVGSVAIKNISHMMNYAEIAYGVAETHQGRGIATAAVAAMIDKAFTESSLRKLFAYVHDQNVASCRILEKLGFTREGLLREHYIINGRAENEIFFGLLKHEWGYGNRGQTPNSPKDR